MQEYDAEDYYKSRIDLKIKEIKEMKKRQMRENCGFGFVSFQSNLQVKRVSDERDFKRLCMRKLTRE